MERHRRALFVWRASRKRGHAVSDGLTSVTARRPRTGRPRTGEQKQVRVRAGGRVMRDIGHFIGGKEVKGGSGRLGDVFNPNTGEVQAKVAFASKAEVGQAIANAAAAQPAWAATNPQRRARVMFKFLELVAAEYDDLARLLSSEHGKTFTDAKGDIQRGLEVVEFACGIPNLMKGEFSDNASPGIDLYSLRQPLGVVAGITPFNFPAMIPLWKAAPAIGCGNAFVLKPSMPCSMTLRSKQSALLVLLRSRSTSTPPARPVENASNALGVRKTI